MMVFVGGAAGTGKTSVCKTLAGLCNRFAYLSFFSGISDLARAIGITKEEKLKRWPELQIDTLRRAIAPIVNDGNNVVLDTHYSFQPAGGANTAFAKRGFFISLGYEMSHSQELLRQLAALDCPILLVLLKAQPQFVEARQARDNSTSVLSIEAIVAEQSAEEHCWMKTLDVLEQYGACHAALQITNDGDIQETVMTIVGAIKRKFAHQYRHESEAF